MSRKLLLATLAGAALVAGYAVLRRPAPPPSRRSPYVAQLESPVRGLSGQEVSDLLAGAGAGYARTAELNGYPGPRHVLEMRAALDLSTAQVQTTEAAFAAMQVQAQRLGSEIVARERALAARFAGRAIGERELAAAVDTLAGLYGRLRATHLAAHLATTAALSDAQIARYNVLRGYTGHGAAGEGEHRHPSD